MVQDEAKLLHRAKEGDGQAFAGLVEPCLDQAYRLALRLAGDPGEAEDALQEALYKAWRALPRFRGDARFDPPLPDVYRAAWSRQRLLPGRRPVGRCGSHDAGGLVRSGKPLGVKARAGRRCKATAVLPGGAAPFGKAHGETCRGGRAGGSVKTLAPRKASVRWNWARNAGKGWTR